MFIYVLQLQMELDWLLRNFVTVLFEHLGPRCFDKGLIVAELGSNKSAFRLFIQEVVARSRARQIARTHRLFMDPVAFEGHRVCRRAHGREGVPSCDTASLRACDSQMEYVFFPKLRVPCAAHRKGVLLLFRFSYSVVGGRRDYVFMKLEGSKALSMSHAISAFHTYALKRLVEGRRETDVSLDGLWEELAADTRQVLQACGMNGCTRAQQRDAARASKQYDEQVRVGHEVFVPAALANGLLAGILP
jgi:hypothetical protein